MDNKDYVKRKQILILKDFDNASNVYWNLEGQISNWRSLTITLLLGYIGFLFTVKVTNNAMVVPLLLIPAPFLFLEIYRRAHLRFLAENMEQIEAMFMLTNETQFNKEVQNYVFRDLKLPHKIVFKNLVMWLKHTVVGFVDLDAVVWYAFIVTASIVAYQFFHI